ncbi:hypothetical protein [Microbacterium paludicola]|uniref:Uncharacterized protein n=1 Tax=Microbacterium paludicola TaxID=300019 RepID=A0A4Y9FU18_9MICO|nr:hypothetical protein [Microbacterium paludicola]TFU32738.1 hypothetical protein E4U02_08985 [Microbacterium paludicola]
MSRLRARDRAVVLDADQQDAAFGVRQAGDDLRDPVIAELRPVRLELDRDRFTAARQVAELVLVHPQSLPKFVGISNPFWKSPKLWNASRSRYVSPAAFRLLTALVAQRPGIDIPTEVG